MEKKKGSCKVNQSQLTNEVVCRTNSLITMLTFFNNRIQNCSNASLYEPKELRKILEEIQVETQNYRDRIDKCAPFVN